MQLYNAMSSVVGITEAIIHGLHSNKEPVYFLSLDALSAYDRVVIEHAVRCAYLAGTQDEGLIYLDNRLRSRRRLVEQDKEILVPIRDTQGVEQGWCASDKIYRLVNNDQLQTAQVSKLGIDLGLVPNDNGGLTRQVLSASCSSSPTRILRHRPGLSWQLPQYLLTATLSLLPSKPLM